MFGLLAQVAEEQTPREAIAGMIAKLWLPIGVLLFGAVIAICVLWLLRGRQTQAEQMQRGQRWLVVCLLGLVLGLGVMGVLQAVL